ncbi:MetQ/NlpA family ABC transporter substrate-binding protein [Nesterenkonia halophila]|uniref:MetQ/NlpA family ABC transporter substrate-binding protein n=1 Tax=Nesterenkonia halophila TaxID=302044 RepID=UPI001290B29D|nr:MetQ/NlpA family ABC transporter substrate-binding protein [Nesterenkonia halophila]
MHICTARRSLSLSAVVAASALALTGCGLMPEEEQSIGTENDDGTVTLTVAANPVPQGQILQFVDEELAADAGLDIEVKEFSGYAEQNQALEAGDVDANYFQHEPYYEAEIEANDYDFEHFSGVHIEPFALYSNSVDSVEDLPEGAQIGINNDPSNQGRGLALLQEAGAITLDEDVDPADAGVNDVAENPKNFEFVEAEAASLARTLDDVDASVINGNYAMESGLTPAEDGLIVEDGQDSPYANFLTVRAGDEEDENVQKLDELLHSDEVRSYIEETWVDGEVQAAF